MPTTIVEPQDIVAPLDKLENAQTQDNQSDEFDNEVLSMNSDFTFGTPGSPPLTPVERNIFDSYYDECCEDEDRELAECTLMKSLHERCETLEELVKERTRSLQFYKAKHDAHRCELYEVMADCKKKIVTLQLFERTRYTMRVVGLVKFK